MEKLTATLHAIRRTIAQGTGWYKTDPDGFGQHFLKVALMFFIAPFVVVLVLHTLGIVDWRIGAAVYAAVLMAIWVVKRRTKTHQVPGEDMSRAAGSSTSINDTQTIPVISSSEHNDEDARRGRAYALAVQEIRQAHVNEQMNQLMHYKRGFHWRSWVKPSLLPILVLVLSTVITFLVITKTDQGQIALLAWALLVIAAGYRIARNVFVWRYSWIEVVDENIYRHYPKSVLYVLNGGEPNINVYAVSNHFEAKQSLLEQMFFRRSCTYTINGPGEQDEVHFKNLQYVLDQEVLNQVIDNNKAIWLELRGNSLQN